MSQQDVLEWLVEQRCTDCDKWFRVKDIQEGLKEKGLGNGTIKGVANDLLCLTACGDIVMRNVGLWNSYKEFRAIIKIT